MKVLLLFIFQLFLISFTAAQEITPKEADSLVIILNKTNPGIDRINLLLKLADYQILKPGEYKADLDTAKTYLDEAATLNRQLKSRDAYTFWMILEARLLKDQGHRKEGKDTVEKVIAILEQGGNKIYLGKAYYDLAMYYEYWDSKQLKKMIPLVEQARIAFEQGGNLEGRLNSLKMLGDLYNLDGQDEKALEALKMTLAVYDSINYKEVQAIYAVLGRIYNRQNDYKQALEYELKALTIAESFHDSTMQLCQIHNILGSIYDNIGKYDATIMHYKAALEIAKRLDDKFTVALLIMYVVGAYGDYQQPQKALEFLSSQPKQYLNSDNVQMQTMISLSYFSAYLTAKKYDYAKTYLDKLLKVANSTAFRENNSVKDDIYRLVVKYHIETGQFSKARTYLNINKENIKGDRNPMVIADNAALWYKVDSADGNFKSAFDNLLLYQTITDSIYKATKSRQFQLILVEYETKKKEDSIRQKNQDIFLLTQKNDQQHANLEQAVFVRNVIIAGTALILIILILLYRQYTLKQKNSRVITHKNELLQHLLTEKEWLLKEIHHRVKNNLQTVMSLLNSQSAYIQNDAALTAIQDSQHRVHAMSLIHQKLYSSENASFIDMPVYVRELIEYMRDCFNTGQRIRFELNIEPLELDVSQAVPLGLILNEAITNSLKYAFPDERNGIINIDLKNTTGNHYLLSISDNGIGMPDNFNNKKPGSLGLSLIKGLSEDIDGTFNLENRNGTILTISFVHDETIKRINTFSSTDAINV